MSEKRAIGLRVLITGASLCVVIAGLRTAGPIIVPVLFAAFLAVLAIRPVSWLQARNLPDWLAVTIVLVGVVGAFTLVSFLIGNSVASFSDNLPTYEARLNAMSQAGTEWLETQGIEASRDSLMAAVDYDSVAGFMGTLVSSIGSLLSDTAFVMLTTGFIMAEAAGLPRKLQAALGDPDVDMDRFSGIINDIQEYLSIKTKISVATGVLATVLCLAAGIDYPVLWGVLAFFLNYIPTIGSIIAAVPPVLLGFLQYGWERATVVLVGYVVINLIMGNVVEPKVMGKRLGLSSLVVFLSLVFWGWIWGPLGMFLSVPLTMVVKILLENSDDLKWVAVLLGSGAEMEERLDPSRSMVHGVVAPPKEPGMQAAEELGRSLDLDSTPDPDRASDPSQAPVAGSSPAPSPGPAPAPAPAPAPESAPTEPAS